MRPSPEHRAREGPPAAADATGEGELDDAPNPAAVPEPHDGSPPGAPKPQFTQDALADGVTLNLSLACDGCTGSLLVRIENATSTPPTLSTQKAFDAPGTGTILAPKEIDAVLMVVDDADKNGQPTPGERIGIWTGGLLKTSEAPDLIELEVGKVPDEPPLPPAEDDPEPRSVSGYGIHLRKEGIRGLACLFSSASVFSAPSRAASRASKAMRMPSRLGHSQS